MGIFDSAKDAISEHGDQVSDALDKAERFADDKTGGKYSDRIEQGGDFARDRLGVGEADSPDSGSAQEQGLGGDQHQQQGGQLGSQEQSGF